MTGEQLQGLIFSWLAERYPSGPDWQNPHFDAYANLPIEIKMIPAFDEIEYNIANGGWAQLLWNCHGCWRQLLDIAREGYKLIGASAQAAAIDELYTLCERDDAECRAAILADESSLENFAEFTGRNDVANDPVWERLFWAESGISKKRFEWLEKNEARVRKAVGRLDA